MTLKKGSSWLEPFQDFINCALQAQKIARKENNEKELETILQRVGSNFFLKDKQLEVEYEKPFLSLRAAALARRRAGNSLKNSLSVTPRGIEPRFSG